MPLLDTHSRVTHRPEPGFALLALVQATLIFTITLVAVPLPLIGVEFDLSTADLVAPAALAQVAALFPQAEDFDRAMARWGGISVLGAAMGTVLSGSVTTWVSWRWPRCARRSKQVGHLYSCRPAELRFFWRCRRALC